MSHLFHPPSRPSPSERQFHHRPEYASLHHPTPKTNPFLRPHIPHWGRWSVVCGRTGSSSGSDWDTQLRYCEYRKSPDVDIRLCGVGGVRIGVSRMGCDCGGGAQLSLLHQVPKRQHRRASTHSALLCGSPGPTERNYGVRAGLVSLNGLVRLYGPL